MFSRHCTIDNCGMEMSLTAASNTPSLPICFGGKVQTKKKHAYTPQKMADVTALATAFLQHYYTHFNGDRAQLAVLYRAESMLTLAGEKMQGAAAIIPKLQSIPKCQAQPITWDCQPSPAGGALILINGNLVVSPTQATKYCETFNIQPVPGAAGQYFILNHVFRVQQ
jgi:hypothetical protein